VKRPPDRKVLLAAMVLLVAAGAVFARTSAVQDNGDPRMSFHLLLKGGR
jgi:hypothetical protein